MNDSLIQCRLSERPGLSEGNLTMTDARTELARQPILCKSFQEWRFSFRNEDPAPLACRAIHDGQAFSER